MLVNTKLLPFVSQCGHFKHGLQCLDWILCIVCPACEQWIVVIHTTLWDKQYLFIITVLCYDEKPQTFLRHLKFCSLFKWFLVCQVYCYMEYYISKYKENFNGFNCEAFQASSMSSLMLILQRRESFYYCKVLLCLKLIPCSRLFCRST